jgi:hypothetical protein
MAIDHHAERIEQLDGVAGLVQNIGGPGDDEALAWSDLGRRGDDRPGPTDDVIIDLPATDGHGQRARVVQLHPLAAAEWIGHKLVDQHCGVLRASGDMACQRNTDQRQGRKPEG